ncbi:MAG: hypothetical protein R3D98_09830 [Candidatus Krumholzibacteriia bacterium]
MRAIGHFCIFVGFFLVFALVLGLLILGALAMKSTLAFLMILPAGPGLYVLYVRWYRLMQDRLRRAGAR